MENESPMPFRRRFLSALVAIAAFAGAATQVASCAFEPYGTQTVDQAKACSTDTNCDDQNPCTIDACQADKTCAFSNAVNAPLMQQIAGDCRRDDCVNGELVPTNDDADITDDSEPCTTDGCGNGNPSHMPLGEGTMCTMGTSPGKCESGICTVECSPTKPCDDQNPCTEDSCNAGVGTCTFSPLDGTPTPGFQEPIGDCKLHICANGVDAPLNDDADVPDDANSCTQDVCTAGVESNPGVSTGTPCDVGQPDVCDGQGACVQCNVAADCVLLPSTDDCQKRTCINQVCGQTFTATDTPISSQAAGDCKQVVCDGTGKTLTKTLDTDVPDDNNPCTKNVCTGGTPTNPDEIAGFSCGNPLICDGSGSCVGCILPSDCILLPPNDFCKTRTCINQQCGLALTPTGTNLPTGQTSQDCKVFECDAVGNIVENPDSADKPIDGNQCTQDLCTAGIPSNPFEMVNASCSQSGGTVCNGAGACKKTNSAVCVAGGDCLSGFCVDGVCCNATCGSACKSCNVPGSVGTCVNVPQASEDAPGCTGTNSCDGAGICKKDDAQGCAGATECVSNFCIDGVCCASGCTTACRVCNAIGSVGVCTNITSGEDNNPANVCANTMTCDTSGACKLKDSQPCTMGAQCVSGQCFDNVCCNVSCSGTCKSCNIAGAVGICSNVASGQDDTNGVPACSGASQSCDGTGVCKKEIAQGCGVNAECLSGFCVDGVCCNGGCTTTCQACNLPGSIGTCSNVGAGQDDLGTCSGMSQSCDGTGACKSEAGVVCSLPASCLSGFCVDGYCCNTTCTETCKSCGLAASLGTCTNIANGQDDTNAPMTCSGATQSCDGLGTCKKENGQTCPMGSAECLSGFCADGVCCNSACGNSATTDCQACSLAAGATIDGTCSFLPASVVCRAKNGVCDIAEMCTGSAALCPSVDNVEPATTICRAKVGDCDIADACDGTTKPCPTDVVEPVTTICRAKVGDCDIADACDGTTKPCPTDVVETLGTVCRMALDICDAAEVCTGASTACPSDVFEPNTTICRPSLGDCDPEETCTGSMTACPADTLAPITTVCRTPAGLCDVQEMCTGMAPICPTDVFESNALLCRAAVGSCDVAENCTGAAANCPANTFAANGTICDPQTCENSTVTNADTCNGAGICDDGGTTSCVEYACNVDMCHTSCTMTAECAAGFTCVGTVCQ